MEAHSVRKQWFDKRKCNFRLGYLNNMNSKSQQITKRNVDSWLVCFCGHFNEVVVRVCCSQVLSSDFSATASVRMSTAVRNAEAIDMGKFKGRRRRSARKIRIYSNNRPRSKNTALVSSLYPKTLGGPLLLSSCKWTEQVLWTQPLLGIQQDLSLT
jgi:hypothetical protein